MRRQFGWVSCIVLQYRGPCPLEHTLMNGDTDTGLAVIRIDPAHIDVGAVVSLTKATVEPADTYDTYVAPRVVHWSPLCTHLRRLPHGGTPSCEPAVPCAARGLSSTRGHFPRVD
jgi:hypothetical protein